MFSVVVTSDVQTCAAACDKLTPMSERAELLSFDGIRRYGARNKIERAKFVSRATDRVDSTGMCV
jgi:hypothetical protein